jgi:hypothetical protein
MINFPVLALAALMAAQGPGPSVTGAIHTGLPTCAAPSADSQWFAYNPSSTCLPGGVACTNGANLDTVPDALGTFPLVTNSGTNAQPVYTTGAVNSLPSWAFDGSATDKQVLRLGAGNIGGPASFCMYAVINATATSGTYPIFASSSTSGGGANNSPIWYINPSGQQQVSGDGLDNVVTGSTVVTGSWKAIAFCFTGLGNTATTYNIAGGTATVDTTAASRVSLANVSNQIGGATFDSLWFLGQIAEVGYYNSVSLAGAATYIQCRYAI